MLRTQFDRLRGSFSNAPDILPDISPPYITLKYRTSHRHKPRNHDWESTVYSNINTPAVAPFSRATRTESVHVLSQAGLLIGLRPWWFPTVEGSRAYDRTVALEGDLNGYVAQVYRTWARYFRAELLRHPNENTAVVPARAGWSPLDISSFHDNKGETKLDAVYLDGADLRDRAHCEEDSFVAAYKTIQRNWKRDAQLDLSEVWPSPDNRRICGQCGQLTYSKLPTYSLYIRTELFVGERDENRWGEMDKDEDEEEEEKEEEKKEEKEEGKEEEEKGELDMGPIGQVHDNDKAILFRLVPVKSDHADCHDIQYSCFDFGRQTENLKLTDQHWRALHAGDYQEQDPEHDDVSTVTEEKQSGPLLLNVTAIGDLENGKPGAPETERECDKADDMWETLESIVDDTLADYEWDIEGHTVNPDRGEDYPQNDPPGTAPDGSFAHWMTKTIDGDTFTVVATMRQGSEDEEEGEDDDDDSSSKRQRTS